MAGLPYSQCLSLSLPDSVLSFVEWGLEGDIIDQMSTVPRTNSIARHLDWLCCLWLEHCLVWLIRVTRQRSTRGALGTGSKQDNAQKWEMHLISQDQPEGAPSGSPKEVTADTAQVPAGGHVGGGPRVVETEWGRSERDWGCPGPPVLRS